MTNIIPHTGTDSKGPDSHYVAEDKKNQMLHQVRVYKGHTLYEVDIDEETIRVMPIESIAVVGGGVLPNTKITTQRKVVTKPNCLYISCLNIKNLNRLVSNAGGRDISSYKIV